MADDLVGGEMPLPKLNEMVGLRCELLRLCCGRTCAVDLLDITDNFFQNLSNVVTMLKPNQRLVGVTYLESN